MYLKQTMFPVNTGCTAVLSLQFNTGYPTRYQNQHFINNFTTNVNTATKFEANLPHCVRNVMTSCHVLEVATISVQTGLKTARHIFGKSLPVCPLSLPEFLR